VSKTTKLGDGTKVLDPRLGLMVLKDDPVLDKLPLVRKQFKTSKLVSRRWGLGLSEVLDQGQTGSCVGMGYGHSLASQPSSMPGVDYTFAHDVLYWGAQRIDKLEGGEYPESTWYYEGTFLNAGARVVKKLGLCRGFYRGLTLKDLAVGVSSIGPAIIGIPWTVEMFEPDSDGFIKPKGIKAGFHCVSVNEVSVNPGVSYFNCPNSWGPSFGVDGWFKLTFQHMEKLIMHPYARVIFLAGRKKFTP